MKVLQIIVVANSGSTGKISEKIGSLAIDKGWVSYIAYGRWYNPSRSTLIKIGNKFDILCHGFKSILCDKHGYGSHKATKKLISTIIKIQPDIIHLHNIHGYYLNFELLFKFLSTYGKPIIWTLHDCWSYTGHCVHYTAINCQKWKVQCDHCPHLLSYPIAITDNSNNNYQKKKTCFTNLKNLYIITVSEWLKKEVEQSFLKNYPILKINNGVDTKLFKPTSSNIREKLGITDKFIILSVATNWIKGKGLKDFINLAQRLNDTYRIILVGINKIQKVSLPPNIIGISKTENVHELIQLYSAADLYISFSIEETFGLTIIESMACGTPALVYDSTACRELINEKVGKVIKVKDLNSAIDFISKVKSLGKDFFSEACRNHILQHYTEEKTISNYISLYNQLLK